MNTVFIPDASVPKWMFDKWYVSLPVFADRIELAGTT